ncbi:hypothetical protein HF1_01740 [Mycoplasma haemofelis str. Langford 1]|uniref:Uncharacterized protein n=1 Tax=Mycoplasma haemofelis (strain Langford 1) TaxID=941640 RepID=E8ZKL6_MYCHL|nr:hypothetical protein [Mycoplasma haemofelis]CBY92182.1 hypothetical protein HF1_01740 [Mycoplasma haemofelis str. Langford 1]
MDPKLKLLMGLGGAGATGGTGMLVYPYLKKGEGESLSTAVTNQGDKFILYTAGDTHNTQWKAIVEEIKNDDIAKKEIGDPIDETKLKKWCEEAANKKSYEEELIGKFKSRCTKNTILTEVKSKLTGGKSLIPLEDSAGWTKSYEEYKKNTVETDLQITIGGEKITNTTMGNKKAEDIRNWCGSVSQALFTADTDPSYKAFNKWCVSGGA